MCSANPDGGPLNLDTSVGEVMTTPVAWARQTETVRDVINKMVETRISALVVVDEESRVKGVVTASDLIKVVLSTDQTLDSDYPHYDDCLWAVDLIQQKLGTDKVVEVMSEAVTTVSSEESIRRAARTMRSERLHHLPVVDAAGHLIGMLSSQDFVKFVAGMQTQREA